MCRGAPAAAQCPRWRTSAPPGSACPWSRGSRVARRSRLASDSADAQVLELEPLLDAVLRALAPDPGLLDAAERRDLGGDDARVDADDPVLEALRHAPDATDVAAVEVRREPVRRVVCLSHRLLLGVEAGDPGNGAEGLLTRHRRVGGDAGDHGRRVEEAAECFPAHEQLAAPRERVRDVPLDLVHGLALDQRTDLGAGLEPRTDLEAAHGVGEPL